MFSRQYRSCLDCGDTDVPLTVEYEDISPSASPNYQTEKDSSAQLTEVESNSTAGTQVGLFQ